jgi:uncharacterized protein (DUF433 family)
METIDLLSRRLYSFGQVDSLLWLKSGTAQRWIDGYSRGGHSYPPVVRVETTGDEVVTWGEFVETRYLAYYRNAGVPILRLRPAIERLRIEFNTLYPLATAKPFVAGKELVHRIEDEIGLAGALRLVVSRSGQLLLNPHAEEFLDSVEFGADDVVARIRPLGKNTRVVMDPLRKFGAPVVRAVSTEVIAESIRAGDSREMIADLYELEAEDVDEAIRYELKRAHSAEAA